MLSEPMLKQLNEQITKELYSSYLYLQMAGFLDDRNLAGMANWMKLQAQEEIAHAMIFYNYVDERGGRIEVGGIDKPPAEYDSPLDVFEKTLEHEKKVTASIHSLMDRAVEEKDYATQDRLQWFIAEQVEEEATPAELIAKLKQVGDGNGLFMLDREMAARSFKLPSPLAGED